MNRQLRDDWVRALRSGKYEQWRDQLYAPGKTAFCCLGVLCEVGERLGAIGTFSEMLGDSISSAPEALVRMNDKEGRDFHFIADWIEANIPVEDAP